MILIDIHPSGDYTIIEESDDRDDLHETMDKIAEQFEQDGKYIIKESKHGYEFATKEKGWCGALSVVDGIAQTIKPY